MKRNRLIFSLVCAVIVGAFAACGGVDSDLFAGLGDSGGDVGDSSIKNDSSTRDGSTSGKDSGTSTDSGGGGGDASSLDGGIIHPKKDAGIIPCGDNGSSGGVGGTTVTCSSTDPVCCASQYPFDMVNPVSFGCTANESSCSDFDSGSIPIECRSSEDCPGTAQCCGHQVTFDKTGTPVTIYDSVRCTVTCPVFSVDGGSTPDRLFCDPSGPNVCPVGETCGPSTLLPGFNVCG